MYLILSILIAMGESIQSPKPESEIRFGWGLSYNYIGQMHHNLNKYDVVVGLEIPDFRVIPYYKPFSRDPKYCHKWNTGIRTKLLLETCQKIWQAYIGTIAKLDDSQERIRHIMEKEIPAVVPDFKLRPAPTETTNGQPNAKRVKRFITDLLSLECMCKNHVQCDISPNILTSEIILPSYQHFLHYIQEKGFSRFSIVSESEILSKYGKTITMIVLARVNGYYSPYFPQSIMEEEAKCLYGTNFSFAERDFFINKLLKENHNMSQEAINQSIAFLERQKEANCPCTIHTQKRGYDWIVFN